MVITIIALLVQLTLPLVSDARADAQPAEPDLARTDVTAFIAQVAEKTKDFKSLRAKFRQQKFMAIAKQPIVSEGTFAWLRPTQNRTLVRWDTQKPSSGLCLVTATELLLYYPELKEAEKYDISRANPILANIMVAPRLAADIQEAFSIRIEQPGNVSEQDDSPHVLLLTPTQEDVQKFIEHMRLWLDPRTLLVKKIEYLDASKDRTVVEFSEVKLNPELKESDFSIELPDDVRVTIFSAKGEKK
jgi:outer membrane lipoprotein-sorting protein